MPIHGKCSPLVPYLGILNVAGFTGMKVYTKKKIEIPKEMLGKFNNDVDATNYMKLEVGI